MLTNDTVNDKLIIELQELKERNAALTKSSDLKFQLLAEDCLNLVARFDRNCRLTYANQSFTKHFGCSDIDYKGKNLAEICVEDIYAKGCEEVIRMTLDSGEIQEIKGIPFHPSENQLFNSRFIPEISSEGKIESVLCISTPDKVEETGQRPASNPFNTSWDILDQMLEGCQIIGFDWRYNYLNPAAELHNRRSRDELLGNRYMDIWPGIENTKLFEAIRQTLEARVRNHFENRFLFPDGEVGWFDVSIQPVPEGALVLSVDISDRKLDQKRLLESELRFIKLWEQGPFGMSLVDSGFRYKSVNLIFSEMIGYSEEELKNLTIKDITYPEDQLKDLQNVQRLINKEISVYRTEKRYIRKDGQVIWAALSVTANYNKEGQFLYNLAITEDISERKRDEEKLKEALDRSSAIIRTSPEAVIVTDRMGVVNLWNDSAEKMFGWKQEEILGKKNMTFATDRIDEIQKVRTAVFAGETVKDIETECIDKAGSIMHVNFSASPLRDAHGHIIGILSIAEDISEKKKMLQDLIMAKEKAEAIKVKLEVALASMSDAVFISDLEGNFVEFNDAFATFHKFRNKEECYKTFAEYPEFLEVYLANGELAPVEQWAVPRALRGETAQNEEFSLRRMDTGETWTGSYSFAPIRDSNGVITGSVVSGRDITESKKAEEALKKSEALFSAIFRSSPIAVSLNELSSGKWFEANNAFINMTGYSREEIIGHTSREINLWKHSGEREMIWQTLIEQGRVYNYETEFVKKNGTTGYIGIYVEKVNLAGRSFLLIMGNEITDKHQMIEDLVIAKEKAEAGDRLKTAFMNNISHEIRTPLNAIQGFTQLISDPSLTDDEREEYHQIINSSSQRLIQTVTDYMDISLIASNNIDVEKKDFPVAGVIEEILKKFEPRCIEKNLTLVVDISEPDTKKIINSDRELLFKIINHLLDNAIKFTKEGKIKIGISACDDSFKFYTRDTGVGIKEEALAAIFKYFVQEDDSNTRLYEGSGLGLSIINGLVKLMGGTIRVESVKGAGSFFEFTLPCKIKYPEIQPIETISIKQTTGNKPLILIAEDDYSNYLLMELLLKSTYKILHAENGLEAVEMCRTTPSIEMVIMDIKMPEMDGLTATRIIKDFRNNLPVVVLTAYAESGMDKKCREVGCEGYLTKPVDKHLLFSMISKYRV